LVEPFWIRPVEYRVWHACWPPELSGFTIVQLSDLHGRVRALRHPTARRWIADADLIAVTGDLYSPTLSRRRLAAALDRLPPARTRFVSGNHDYRHGRLDVAPWDPAPGVALDNRLETYEGPRGHRVRLAGVPDLVRGRPAWHHIASDGADADGASLPGVLLSHRPDAVLAPEAAGFQLVLAGHTHGGQVALPGYGPILRHSRLPRGDTAGLVRRPEGRWLVVSRGLGTSELPVRFWARPEVVRVVLSPSEGA
jgi:predicted MPP superfamily phosphohydrolase